ncbi:hypothetical protein ACLB2K_011436 [Fragaria x ananassa]
MLTASTMKEACTSVGVAKYGRPIGLDEKIKVDLIVIGSVAVDPRTGARLGKGEGFAELEYGMLRYMGAIDDSTPVVTTVHDSQLVDDIPIEKLLVHDVPVDIICTPTQVIFTNTSIPKPQEPTKSAKIVARDVVVSIIFVSSSNGDLYAPVWKALWRAKAPNKLRRKLPSVFPMIVTLLERVAIGEGCLFITEYF